MAKTSPSAFLHDANSRSDEKILELRSRGGWAAYGLFWAMVEMMREATAYKLSHSRIPAIALGLAVDRDALMLVIEDCISVGLFASDEKHFWAPSLLCRMEKYNAMVEKRKNAGRLGALQKQQNRSTCLANAKEDESKCLENEKQNLAYAKYNIITSTSEVPVPLDPEVPPETPHPFLKYFNTTEQDLSSGRFAMKKYPWMWLHPQELQDAREQWERAGMALEDWRAGCRACNAAMEGKQHDHRLKGGLALLYLTTHILTNALEQKRKELGLRTITGEKPKPRNPIRMPAAQPEAVGQAVGAILKNIIPGDPK